MQHSVRSARRASQAAPRSNRAAQARAAQVEQQRRAQNLRDAQLGEADVDDESAWPEWDEQPLQLRRRAAAAAAGGKPGRGPSKKPPAQREPEPPRYTDHPPPLAMLGSGRVSPTLSGRLSASSSTSSLAPVSPDRTGPVALDRTGPSESVKRLMNTHGGLSLTEKRDVFSALVFAVHNDDIDAANELLTRHGANVHGRDGAGRTLLATAARAGHADMARLLVQAGASPDDVDLDTGKTALAIARELGHTDVVEALDPSAAAAARARRARAAAELKAEEEAAAAAEAAAGGPVPPPLVEGRVFVLDHRARLDCALSTFRWAAYERGLAAAAAVDQVWDVYVTPEPGDDFLTAHTTVVVRSGASEQRAARVSNAIRALQNKQSVRTAAGGARLLGAPRVTLVGEVAELAAPVLEVAEELFGARAEYRQLVDMHESLRKERAEEDRRLKMGGGAGPSSSVGYDGADDDAADGAGVGGGGLSAAAAAAAAAEARREVHAHASGLLQQDQALNASRAILLLRDCRSDLEELAARGLLHASPQQRRAVQAAAAAGRTRAELQGTLGTLGASVRGAGGVRLSGPPRGGTLRAPGPASSRPGLV